MKFALGMRKADIARRETGVVSWLGFRQPMAGKELADLYSEWTAGPYAHWVNMLTELALESLIQGGTVKATTLVVQSVGLEAFGLVDPSVANRVDPKTVELTPREVTLMGLMSIRRSEPKTVAQLDINLGEQVGPDSWRTQACLGHLAKLGLLQVVEDSPDAYKLV